jgi:hypothetical protein
MADKKMYFIPFYEGPAQSVDLDKCKQALEKQIDTNNTAKEMAQLIASSDAPLMVKLNALLSYVMDGETALGVWVSNWIRYHLGDTEDMDDPETNGELWDKQAWVLLNCFRSWLSRYNVEKLYERSSLLRTLCEHGEWFDSKEYPFWDNSLPFDGGEEQSFAEVLQTLYATNWREDHKELWIHVK